MHDPSSFANPTPLAHADASRDVLPRGGTSQDATHHIRLLINPIAFVADMKMAFLMIKIDESERDFTRFFWEENPGIDLENKRLEIFWMTRILFGVKSSQFLLADTIRHHLKKYVDIFPDTFNHLNQTLYVDDFLCGNVSVQEALTTCVESRQILKDASVDLQKWRTDSSKQNQRLKSLNFELDEHKELLNTLIASKVLGVALNEKSDTFYFDSSDLETFLSKRINTKRYLLQAASRLFDPVGFVGPYTIRIKCLIEEIWCLGLGWDDKLPKQLEVLLNKWCNEIQYLSEINSPQYTTFKPLCLQMQPPFSCIAFPMLPKRHMELLLIY
ncbi:uncharacterized protein TNCV_2486021 [Trichonephila clavipes]|uniref:Reverse transcriptase domain-containing protein n=1 Tax=Trichonephila clavipes TaxID=2585209 RepID=A0A8X6VZY1_TRICX|nr:uncharacterized protein TNCV_2486021 [Trichonephila clavipes]